jgi:hypothetical protein
MNVDLSTIRSQQLQEDQFTLITQEKQDVHGTMKIAGEKNIRHPQPILRGHLLEEGQGLSPP